MSTKMVEYEKRPTHIDLFSGIGGFSLAFESEGFETIGFSEIDPYACAVLRKHWPAVKNFGDIRNVPAVRCDVLTGGFPCQPFSSAGKRKGKEDVRHLWPAMRAVIERCQPAWVLCENVAGIINMELDNCVTDLENIGYSVQPIIVPACAVDAKHRRDRVWILAHRNEPGREEQCGTITVSPQQSAAECCGETVSDAMLAKQRRDERQEKIKGDVRHGNLQTKHKVKSGSRRKTISTGSQQPERHYASWAPESSICRVVYGIPERSHQAKEINSRLKCLGNSIVPQVAQEIARCIYQCLTVQK